MEKKLYKSSKNKMVDGVCKLADQSSVCQEI